MSSDKKSQLTTSVGHRQRLWQRILKHGAERLDDYELLEVCLFAANPRKDTRTLARRLINKFGSLNRLVKASSDQVMTVPEIGASSAALIQLLGSLGVRLAKEKIERRHVLANWKSIIEFCRVSLAHQDQETCLLIFLNNNKEVIYEETHQVGSVNHIGIYPREITKLALAKAASFVILAHNHPDGDCSPSKEDLRATNLVAQALRSVGISLFDHVVVAEAKHFSFRNNRLL